MYCILYGNLIHKDVRKVVSHIVFEKKKLHNQTLNYCYSFIHYYIIFYHNVFELKF